LSGIVFENDTSFSIDLTLVKSITDDLVQDKEVELLLTTNDYIQEINNSSRGINKPTDVLSFPYINMPHTPLGSIVISADFVCEKAELYNHSFHDEFVLLYIHGILHLLGYDHEVDDGEHRQKEEEIIKRYNLPDSLIVRNS